nr:Piwi domain-containing protein [Candidatus Sigynarchaeota archaeon]
MNLFPVLTIPDKIYLTEVSPKHDQILLSDANKYLTIKHTALVAKILSIKDRPVASYGTFLVSAEPIDPSSVTTTLQVSGIVVPLVKTVVKSSKNVDPYAMNGYYLRNWLNKLASHHLKALGYVQNERFFWKTADFKTLAAKFKIKLGLLVRASVHPEKREAYLLVDFKTRYYSKQNVLETIQAVVKAQGVASWRNLDATSLGFLRGMHVETTYPIWSAWNDCEEFQGLTIDHVDLSRSITDPIPELGFSPLAYHENEGRGGDITDRDQPVIIQRGKNGRADVSHVPSLLIESPSLENLKKYSPDASMQAAHESRLDIASRHFVTYERVEELIKTGIIAYPAQASVEVVNPTITMGHDFLEIKSDEDFSRYFAMKKVAKPPECKSMRIVVDSRHMPIVDPAISAIQSAFKDFKIPMAVDIVDFASKLKIGSQAYYRDLAKFIMEQGKATPGDAMLAWFVDNHDDPLYTQVKASITVGLDIPTQEMVVKSIKKYTPDKVRKGYVNPLFTQLVAKMGGYPYLFQEGITITRAVFIGIDRFRDAAKEKPSVTAAAACFGNQGEYLGASASNFDARADDDFGDLEIVLGPMLDVIKDQHVDFKHVIVLRDGLTQDMTGEQRAVFNTLASRDLTGAFVSANKSPGLRVYKGDPTDIISGEKTEQYLLVNKYPDPAAFVVTTTLPIKDMGVARPVLYKVEKSTLPGDSEINKLAIARAVMSFTRLNWTSFKGTQLPAPLSYAHDLADFCSANQVRWPPSIRRPTYL